MNDIKIKKPKRTYDELDIADAAGAYLDHNADMQKTKRTVGRKWTMNDLRYYERERHWPLLLSRTQQRVDERIVEDAVGRRTDQLVRLRNTRVRLYQQVVPREGSVGARANSMEGCAKALVDVMNMEREITGDKNYVPPPGAGVMIFLRDRILKEGSFAFNPSRETGNDNGDPTNRVRK